MKPFQRVWPLFRVSSQKGPTVCIHSSLKVLIHRVGHNFFLNGTKLYARIHFDRKCFIFMKLCYNNNNMLKASRTLALFSANLSFLLSR